MPAIRHRLSTSVNRLRTPMPRSNQLELMDENIEDVDELAENFRDIQRVNGLLGGTAIILRHLPALIGPHPRQPISILDLATGSADIPVAIVRWARRRNVPISIVASDASPPILDLAQASSAPYPEIATARYDARQVPLPDRQFDIVLCSLSLHHFDRDDAVRVLSEMRRLARRGFILNDLRRGRIGYAAAWLASRLTTRNRLTRNDAPLSVRRAYTTGELDSLLRRAGVEGAQITTHPWFRMAAVAQTGGADDLAHS